MCDKKRLSINEKENGVGGGVKKTKHLSEPDYSDSSPASSLTCRPLCLCPRPVFACEQRCFVCAGVCLSKQTRSNISPPAGQAEQVAPSLAVTSR